MKKVNKKIRSTGKIKAGIQCPACGDIIFSLHRHDFRRCMCGKVFIDGGDDYMRIGAEAPIKTDNIRFAYRPQRAAEKLMSPSVRDKIPMAPPPTSYCTERGKYQVLWHWSDWSLPRNCGSYPKDGKFNGCIYRWIFLIGPLEIRRWAE